MIKCLIVDDEPLAQEVIERYILQMNGLELVKKCSNAIEAYAVLEKEPVDLLFLDIQMPAVSGLQLVRSLKHPPAIIFTTAYSEYAVDSYEIDAVDYLLKPVTFARFKKSVDKYLKQSQASGPQEKDHVYIKTNGRLAKICYGDILFAESMKDYMKIVTITGKHITHLTMKALADLLPAGTFIRIHRSYIVNTRHIKAIGKKEVEVSGHSLTIGDSYREGLAALLKGDGYRQNHG